MAVIDEFELLADNFGWGDPRLPMRVDDLLATLGAPGDWGYDTKLGELTRILFVVRKMLAEVERD